MLITVFNSFKLLFITNSDRIIFMEERYSRTAALYGDGAIEKLNNSNVIVFGLGGVGSYAVEALVRAGVGAITLVDSDEYSLSNLNRQLYATEKTVGIKKTKATSDRIKEISISTKVTTVDAFVLEDDLKNFDFTPYDYVIDAIDTVSGKLGVIVGAQKAGVKVISCMGAGNKKDPTLFRVEDIFKTKVCPLCKVMRKLLKERGVDSLNVVYSEETPSSLSNDKRTPASNSFVPGVVGLIAAGKVINDLVGE